MFCLNKKLVRIVFCELLDLGRHALLGKLRDKYQLMINVRQQVLLENFLNGYLHELLDGLCADLARVQPDEVQYVLDFEFILLDCGLDHAEELPPVLMLHNVKGLKDLEATTEEPDLSRLHLDVPDGDLCCFV